MRNGSHRGLRSAHRLALIDAPGRCALGGTRGVQGNPNDTVELSFALEAVLTLQQVVVHLQPSKLILYPQLFWACVVGAPRLGQGGLVQSGERPSRRLASLRRGRNASTLPCAATHRQRGAARPSGGVLMGASCSIVTDGLWSVHAYRSAGWVGGWVGAPWARGCCARRTCRCTLRHCGSVG